MQRFYLIKHDDVSVVRAWQAHRFEEKYFFAVAGKFLIAWVEIDNFDHPNMHLKASFHILTHNQSEILHLPAGYANGMMALEPGSELLVFSPFSLQSSGEDNYRFDKSLWFDWDAHRESGISGQKEDIPDKN